MKISTKGRYALKLMYDIALNANGGTVSLKEVSLRQKVSVKYLEQIVPALTSAGYLKSLRGASGGYSLTKKPSEYTVGMIVRLLEGDVEPAPCTALNSDCPNAFGCVEKLVWFKVKEAVNEVMDSITLEDMVEQKI